MPDPTLTHATLDQRTRYLLDAVGTVLTQEQGEILACNAQSVLVTGGVQAGKSLVSAKKLLREFFNDVQRAKEQKYRFPLVYWLVAADYERTREEFNYIANDFAVLGLLHRMSKRVDPGFIEIASGNPAKPVLAVIRTRSAKDATTLAMEAPMGIIACEASQLDYGAYLKLLERIAPHKAWLFLSGTMEGSIGWYPQLRQKWALGLGGTGFGGKKAFSLPSHSNLYLYPEGRNDPAIRQLKADSPDDFFMERMEGIPCPPRGLVMTEFDPELHVRDVPFVKGEPVTIGYDPGFDHAAALEAVQIINGQVRVFDEIYAHGLLIEEVIEAAQAKEWWPNVIQGVIDVSGRYHAGQQQPVATIWESLGRLYMAAQKVPINEGTDRFKSFLKVNPQTKEPRLVFDSRCRGIISELGGCASPIDGLTHVYRWHTDAKGDVVGVVPEDHYNDGIKCVVYVLVDKFGYLVPNSNRDVVKLKFFGRPTTTKVSERRRLVKV